jgi:ornithine cyclodeaminase
MTAPSITPFISGENLAEILPMVDAIDALEKTFAAPALPITPPRQHMATTSGELLTMPAWGDPGVGVKLITIDAANPERGLPLIHGVYVLFSPDTHELLAVFDGGALTKVRTAAVSGLATRHLARADASHLLVFGAGVQAAGHIDAMRAVRPIERVTIVARHEDAARALATEVGGTSGAAADVAVADIICTCTTSSTPVFDGTLVSAGTHINAIGAYRPTDRELDDDAVSAGRVIVETKDAALSEAGDIVLALEHGAINRSQIEELSTVVRVGLGRASDDEVTVFKSVGVAFEDLTVAAAAYENLTR